MSDWNECRVSFGSVGQWNLGSKRAMESVGNPRIPRLRVSSSSANDGLENVGSQTIKRIASDLIWDLTKRLVTVLRKAGLI